MNQSPFDAIADVLRQVIRHTHWGQIMDMGSP